jgi:hypothetical protein
MIRTKKITNEELRRRVAKHIWLMYYNDYLFQQGVITEDARNRMKIKIDRVCQHSPADPDLYSGVLVSTMLK